jgi:hypothetical protein
MFLAALALGIRWSSLSFEQPPNVGDTSIPEVTRRYLWDCSLVALGGVSTGVLVIGAGGRLAMRLLAITSGDDAQGRVTEANEVVGQITLEGTIGFILFNGVFGGLVAGALYLLVRRLLPPRWVGGIAFGIGLLVVFGTTIDPLRSDNPDFDIVGPGWLSVLVFVTLSLVFGLVMASFMARASAWLPVISAEWKVLVRYIPAAVVAAIALPITVFFVLVGGVVVLATRSDRIVRWVNSRAFITAGRVVLATLIALFLPTAITSIVDIATR